VNNSYPVIVVWYNKNLKKYLILISFILIAYSLKGQENNGISVGTLADRILVKYDQDSDGIIDVNKDSFLRTEIDDDDNGKNSIVIKTESRGLLFTDADSFGNKDGQVTKAEFYDFLNTFDEDRDGEITSYKNIFVSLFGGESEWKKFDSKYGERFKYEEKKD